jgi:hypothetical protein
MKARLWFSFSGAIFAIMLTVIYHLDGLLLVVATSAGYGANVDFNRERARVSSRRLSEGTMTGPHPSTA